MGELLPCPFCGGDRMAMHSDESPERHLWCVSCEASGPTTDSEQSAIAAWNRRAPVPSGWRSIKSCPRDGTYVRVTYEDGGEGMNKHRWSGETRGEWVHADGNALAWKPVDDAPFAGNPEDLP